MDGPLEESVEENTKKQNKNNAKAVYDIVIDIIHDPKTFFLFRVTQDILPNPNPNPFTNVLRNE